jgi:hypothetical protein
MATLIGFNGSSTSTSSTAADHRLAAPAVELAYTNDVMLEQLEFLLDHTAEHGICGCSTCQRYLRARAVLMEIFAEPPATLARAA